MFKTLSSPLLVQWEVTDRCNKNCVYCYNFWRGKHGEKDTPLVGSPDLYDHVVDQLISSKVFSVVITGGEPLLVGKRILPQIRRMSLAGIDVSLNSNLSLLTDDIASALKDCGVKSILTSIPSGNSSTDFQLTNRRSSLTHTTRGVQIAISKGFHVTSNMVVSKKNLHEIFSTAQYVQQLGVTAFSATKVSKPTNCSDFSDYLLSLDEFRFMADEVLRVKTELEMKVESLEAYPVCSLDNVFARDTAGFSRLCSAGKTYCVVSADGNMRPCILVSTAYGNILEGLTNCWLAMSEWRTDELIPQLCQNCTFRATCAGGCRADARSINGSLSSPDPYCDFSRPPHPRTNTGHRANAPQKFLFNPKTRMRKEEFGGILYVNSSSWAAVGERLFSFAEVLLQSNSHVISLETFASNIGADVVEAKKTVDLLLNKRVLSPYGQLTKSKEGEVIASAN